MDSDDDDHMSHAQSKQYSVLQSDLSAALAAFDRAQDWADLIHDLQRVNRVLNKHSGSAYLPEKTLLAKRLAQCLTSSLPSGVHLKALETYHLVFTRIGPSRLARDLPLYAGGLFPLFSHCSTSLKAPLLALYDNHFIPLRSALCPILDGFVLAILPGVEDESSEFYSRSRAMLDALCVAVGDVGVFARALWRALLLSPPMRLSASHYLRSKLAAGDGELRAEMVCDMPLVSYAITAALSDRNALTQRSVLDLLLGELALDSPFFQSEDTEHHDAAVALVGGVFGALLRRDMSLTKRVHAWLLGGKEGDMGVAFCALYTTTFVLAAIDNEILAASPPGPSVTALVLVRPCKIVAALVDRSELLHCLGDHFALRILRHGQTVLTPRYMMYERDIRMAVGDVFQELGSARVFVELEKMLARGAAKSRTDFDLLSFALSLFPTKDEVVRRDHLPRLLRVAVESLDAASTDCDALETAVAFCSKALVSMGLSSRKGSVSLDVAAATSLAGAVASFTSFFVAWLAQSVQSAPVEVRRAYQDVAVADEVAAEIQMASHAEETPKCASLAKGACSFFIAAVASGVGGEETTRSALQATAKCVSVADVRIALAGASAFAEISAFAGCTVGKYTGFDDQKLGVLRRAWRQLHPSLRTATPQSAQVFLLLQRHFPEEAKIVIADGVLASDLARRLRNLERFACLWRLAVEHRLMPLPSDDSLFLLLDALSDEDWAPKMLARSWLADALAVDAAAVLDAPLRLLLTTEARTVGQQHEFGGVYDAPRALYGFQVLRSIMESCQSSGSVGSSREHAESFFASEAFSSGNSRKRSLTGFHALAATSPSARTTRMLAATFSIDSRGMGVHRGENPRGPGVMMDSGAVGEVGTEQEGPVVLSKMLPALNYVVVLALTALGYLRGRVPDKFRSADALKKKPSTDFDADDEDDELLWLFAGLGFRSLAELHAGVEAAAAECLAKLLTVIPSPSQMSAFIANLLAEPVLCLLKGAAQNSDPVLQLHYLDAMECLLVAEGPAYISSRHSMVKALDTTIVTSSSFSVDSEPSGVSDATRGVKRDNDHVQLGSVEAQPLFLPWLLSGVRNACRSQEGHNVRSQEVLGVRRRWIHFLCTMIAHIGVALPSVTEGLILILCRFLRDHNEEARCLGHQPGWGDSEFSRIDQRLVLLKGLSVVTSSSLWSFEYALSMNELKDGVRFSPQIQSSDSMSTAARRVANGVGPSASVTPAATVTDAASANDEHTSTSALTGLSSGNVLETASSGSRATSVTGATASMMNAINPLRMLNDFVSGVFTGSSAGAVDGHVDPRRASARAIFSLLPDMMATLAEIWGPQSDVYLPEFESSGGTPTRGYMSTNGGAEDHPLPPRLSREIPRERRQAQRAAALAVIEPLFKLRPTDVIAAIISLFCNEQAEDGILPEDKSGDAASNMAVAMVRTVAQATPELVVTCVSRILEHATKWDGSSAAASDGKAQAALRARARSVAEAIVDNGVDSIRDEELGIFGEMSPGDGVTSVAGGTVGLGLVLGNASTKASPSADILYHKDMFHVSDFFAVYAPGEVEIACLRFLGRFFSAFREGDDPQSAWPDVHSVARDALSSGKRKSTPPAVLCMLSAFASKCKSPLPDRRHRKELMLVSASAVGTCSVLASGAMDLSNEPPVSGTKDSKRRFSILALRALSTSVPVLIDSAFLDDRPQLSSTAGAALSPSGATLKRTAARAASIRNVAENRKRSGGLMSSESSPRHQAESRFDIMASRAASDLLLQISKRDWGVKLARRELVSLLDDQNFFFGKENDVLARISAVVREIVAGGGAASLIASIGHSTANGTAVIPGLFTGRDSEVVLRGRAIRRVAFCVFVAEPDHYSPQLPSVLERLRDALRMADAVLVAECFLCLRVLLLRTGPSSISAFRATTLSEIFRIASQPTENLAATVAALQLLDLMTILSPPDYGYERCFFFAEERASSDGLDIPPGVPGPYQPLVSKLASLWTSGDRSNQDKFAPPLRLETGRTVFCGARELELNVQFVGRYAAALVTRNAMPVMATGDPDLAVIQAELEREFLQ